jgi:hypothetical protein
MSPCHYNPHLHTRSPILCHPKALRLAAAWDSTQDLHVPPVPELLVLLFPAEIKRPGPGPGSQLTGCTVVAAEAAVTNAHEAPATKTTGPVRDNGFTQWGVEGFPEQSLGLTKPSCAGGREHRRRGPAATLSCGSCALRWSRCGQGAVSALMAPGITGAP